MKNTSLKKKKGFVIHQILVKLPCGIYITLLHITLPGIEGARTSDLIIFASIVFVKIYGRIDFFFFAPLN